MYQLLKAVTLLVQQLPQLIQIFLPIISNPACSSSSMALIQGGVLSKLFGSESSKHFLEKRTQNGKYKFDLHQKEKSWTTKLIPYF